MYVSQSYTGVELLRVLIANGAGPILMIAFTNHALDHMLRSVLDAQITNKIVRLGSRSADERIAEFSIEHVEMVAGKSRLNHAFYEYRRALRDVEDEIKKFMEGFFKTDVDTEDIVRYLMFDSPMLLESIQDPPAWISAIQEATEEQEGWHVAGADGKDACERDDSLYGFWVRGGDIEFLHNVRYDMRHRQTTAAQQRAVHPGSANRFEALSSEALDEPQDISLQTVMAEGPTREEGAEAAAAAAARDAESDSDSDDFVSVDASPEEEWLNDAILLDLDDPDSIEAADEPQLQPASSSPPDVPAAAMYAPESSSPTSFHAAPRSNDIRPDDFVDLRQFFAAYGCPDVPTVPVASRPIHELLGEIDAWSMSATERRLLHNSWSDEVRITSQETQTQEFRRLHEKHARAAQEYQEGQAEVC